MQLAVNQSMVAKSKRHHIHNFQVVSQVVYMEFHNFNTVKPSILLALEITNRRGHFWPMSIYGSCVCKTDATMDWLVFQLVVISALTAQGLHINTTKSQVLKKAVGENVKLKCEFTTALKDAGPLEVKWSMKSICHPMEKAEILLYMAGQTYDGYYGPQKGRVYFHSEDPGKGNASIDLLLLTTIYYCQVKKVPGIKNIKTVLQVLEPPSKPRCYHTEGAGKVGKA